MKDEIERALMVLVGLPLWTAGRAADLQWFHFGRRHTVPTRRGGTKVVGDFALHVLCAWRITGPSGIVVASRDRYYPAGDPDEPGPDFQWDAGPNRCDERLAAFLDAHSTCPLPVEAVQGDDLGSFG